MKRLTRRLFALLLAIVLVISNCSFCLAREDYQQKDSYYLWCIMKDSKDLIATEEGIFLFNSEKYVNRYGYDEIMKMLEFGNKQVSEGFLKVDVEKKEYYTDIVIDNIDMDEVKMRVDKALKETTSMGASML